jgi:hypothetical protein
MMSVARVCGARELDLPFDALQVIFEFSDVHERRTLVQLTGYAHNDPRCPFRWPTVAVPPAILAFGGRMCPPKVREHDPWLVTRELALPGGGCLLLETPSRASSPDAPYGEPYCFVRRIYDLDLAPGTLFAEWYVCGTHAEFGGFGQVVYQVTGDQDVEEVLVLRSADLEAYSGANGQPGWVAVRRTPIWWLPL